MQALENYSLKQEEEILEFWKQKKIPEKAAKANAKSKKTFYFMDGPPYATGHIHMGTALNKILKDVAIRSKRMQGYDVFCRAGYDTHGLPIEHKVEKELGIERKQQIEEYGVQKFVDACRKFATEHIDSMNAEFLNLGAWLDYSNAYLTLTNEYIEAIWWTFKKAEEKGLLYLGKYPVHACPRCATAVAYNEIEYIKQTDNAIFVKFPVKGKEKTFLIIWTTTPWTLPGNTGVMVHPKYEYADVKMSNGDHWIIAKDLVEEFMKQLEAGYVIEKVYVGKELEGWKYENPLSKNLNFPEEELKNGYRVILSDRYVNLEEGTGLVHSAPGHGKEDFDAGTKAGLPVVCPVGIDGKMDSTAGKYAGGIARVIDSEIVKDLENDGFLIYKHPYTHDYPVCWRCKFPLLMISSEQWFFKIAGIREKLIEENKSVQWIPDWMLARMNNWLESLGDWPISRERYWGTPLPIWVCEKCGKRKVIGSVEELKKEAGLKEVKDLHKPFIDSVKLKCSCKNEMTRVPYVMDVWFDAGVSSWGALDYPLRKDLFERFWPATLNIEGTDQVRGWWNSQIITSMICFDKKPFESIAVHGMVLDVDKKKMSKSIGNVVQPSEVIKQYNRDFLRYFLIKNSKGDDLYFDWNAFKDIAKFFNILWNSFNYVSLYLKLDFEAKLPKAISAEDKWLVSRINSLSKQVIEHYNKYTFFEAIALLEDFVLEDLSRTYIKLVRNRTSEEEKAKVNATISYTLFSLLKLMAPIAPHITEYIYLKYKNEKLPESIHLLSLPVVEEKFISKELEEEMKLVKDLSQIVLSLRSENNLRLRWLLESVVIERSEKEKEGNEKKGEKKKENEKEKAEEKEEAEKKLNLTELAGVLAKMVNVKKVEVKEKVEGNFVRKEFNNINVCLNLDTSPALKEEWEFRELVRIIQEKRKELALNPNDVVAMSISCDDNAFLKKFLKQLQTETNTKATIVAKPISNASTALTALKKLLEKSFWFELKK